jgi:hypothetical protein
MVTAAPPSVAGSGAYHDPVEVGNALFAPLMCCMLVHHDSDALHKTAVV